jgi:hypothetical protein
MTPRFVLVLVLVLVLVPCACGSPSTRLVAPHPTPLGADASELAARRVALHGRVVVAGREHAYDGSGFVWRAESSCYEATAWLEGKTATTDDHLRLQLCPASDGLFSVAIRASVDGDLHVADPLRARVGLALDEAAGVVVLVFGAPDARPDDVVAFGRTPVALADGTVIRFAGRIASTIRLERR